MSNNLSKPDEARMQRIRDSVAYFKKAATWHELTDCEKDRELLLARVDELMSAIKKHHDQKADDRCFMDDDVLYSVAGLIPVDRRVGDKEAMLANCKRFLEQRCEAGGWRPYTELEKEIEELKAENKSLKWKINHQTEEDNWNCKHGKHPPDCGV
jgi:hypothetical protein